MNNADVSEALALAEEATQALGPGLYDMFLVFTGIFALLWYVLSSLGYLRVFQKAGQRGWFAFVPLLRDYARYKMAWTPKAFWIYLVSFIIFQIIGDSIILVLKLLVIITGVITIVMQIKIDLRIAKSFGKSTLWGIFLFFFPFIATMILGFGKATYIGNPSKQ